MIVQIVLIIPVVSNDVQKIGTVIWNTTRTEMDLVAWIELSSIQTIRMIM